MEDIKDKILRFIKEKGPILPADVSGHINSNILMASAHLSELISNGRLKVSNVKVGGSPLYLLPGQESQLQKFSGNLHEKEKKAYELLLQKKVLRDNELEPVIRVALRAIKDYAVPLEVNFHGSSEIFWRWYLFTNKEAEGLIRESMERESVERESRKEKESMERESIKKEGTGGESTERKDIETQKPAGSAEPAEQPEKKAALPERKDEKIKQIKPKTAGPQKTEKSLFSEAVSGYFNRNKISVLSREIIRKAEIDFIVQVPSAVGNLEYYCKAKSKSKINDSDIASAFAQGQLRKLPVLFITNGELTKRAKEMLQKDFKGVGVRNV